MTNEMESFITREEIRAILEEHAEDVVFDRLGFSCRVEGQLVTVQRRWLVDKPEDMGYMLDPRVYGSPPRAVLIDALKEYRLLEQARQSIPCDPQETD